MNLPNELKFQFISNDKPVKDLLVYIILLANKKNNYTLKPLMTDKNGVIQISQRTIIRIIKNEMTNHPMDYKSTIEDCSGIELIVESMDKLKKRVEILSDFYPQDASELEKAISICSNSKYAHIDVFYEFPLQNQLIQIKLKEL
jgi:hypothetical protein